MRSCCSFTESTASCIETGSTTASEVDIPAAPPAATAPKTCGLCDEVMKAADGRYYYTTRLHCGHRFHDECLIPQLNISMSCPTCDYPVTNDM
ncbi:unnamed protein product [Phytophthora lilii]|uniref:Unnamed protein product n=1 Tax=Phytophthora lilii TaxID=2077276 RepID=A0A9W6X240_9STRA|nr:unnamed protein product [Phytophthora lilii]